ncbi:MAG: hypothetical protein ABF436_08910 [Acetobacter okinawensis]|uniref:hypothetical protein n=1 Tax=Acetobacter okinawensis TaxID=1076594 RepID=UPI0039E9D0E6
MKKRSQLWLAAQVFLSAFISFQLFSAKRLRGLCALAVVVGRVLRAGSGAVRG